ncbi:uncharacterized protein BO97DRAFT_431978 [Aspergillus homomorphus CBS 101889]|uniref:JmjC domain-containing protein n=1 Tax=Aspergillus homomorphus (strain CBS 101889) TaxID=1450537 RepID=A0A395I6J8_ASPHC|nr:hypothetical protein BO97DRAFT_431978 [Aspergillus homomorphus CBS 101889]RAL15389.1 hypothetical protein BO97DRAFT_431978 [Aspergillus homomorphus CBS 101889]
MSAMQVKLPDEQNKPGLRDIFIETFRYWRHVCRGAPGSRKAVHPVSRVYGQRIARLSDTGAHVWLDGKLRAGIPFVIRGLKTPENPWDDTTWYHDLLDTLSATRESLRSLYAKDLQCPEDWARRLDSVLQSSFRHRGTLDMFRLLPEEIAPEGLMAHVGTRNSFSGFNRCFSGTVALNLLIQSEDRYAQPKYDAFMEELRKSPHTDWANLTVTQLRRAKFPIYVTDRHPGDLVIFPPATAHQVWNVNPLVTKLVWTIMHNPGRVSLIPLHALESRHWRPGDIYFFLSLFLQMYEEEDIENELGVQIELIDTQGAVVECSFCGLTIWNRHLHCEQCGDFDLCLRCFVSGRSCKHPRSYTWAELLPRDYCENIISSALNKLGRRLPPIPLRTKQLSPSPPPTTKAKPVRVRVKPLDKRRRIGFFLIMYLTGGDAKERPRSHGHSQELPKSGKRLKTDSNENELVERQQTDGSHAFIDRPKYEPRVSQQANISTPIRECPADQAELFSRRSQDAKGQFRISDPVEDRHRDEMRQTPRALIKSGSSIASTTSEDNTYASRRDVSIAALERKMASLVDSHAKLLKKVAKMQRQVEEQKRSKAEALLNNLYRDSPHLADIVREEARRRGF